MIANATLATPRFDAAHDLADATRRQGIRARVVRSRPDELDVLVHAPDRGRFEVLLRERGFLAVPTPGGRGRTADRDRRFHAREGLVIESMTTWAFDPAGGHSHRWIVPGLSEAILDAASAGPGPSDDAPLHLAKVLHETINRGGRRPDALRGALVAWSAADPSAETARRFLGTAVAGVLEVARAEALGNGSVDVKRLFRGLARAVRRASLRFPVDHLVRSVRETWDRAWHRRLGRRQIAVALLGPDGVGKTTVAGLVASSETPPRTARVYGYNGRAKATGVARLARRVVKAIFYVREAVLLGTGAPRADLAALAEIGLRRAENHARALGLRLTGNHLVDVLLLDRGTIDEAIGLMSTAARARARRLLSKPLPGSDTYAVLLVDDPAAIHARKDEKTIAEIAGLIEGLRRGLAEFRDATQHTELDIRGMTPADVARSVAGIVDRLLDREARRAPSTPVPPGEGAPEIRFFAAGFPGPDMPVRDGVHRAVAGVAAALAEAGHRVVVVGQGGTGSRYRRDGYEVVTFAGGTRMGLSRDLVGWFYARSGAGLTVLNGVFNPLMFALSRRLVRRGMPYVHVTHLPYNDAVFAEGRLRKKIWWQLAERRLLRDAAAVQVLDARHGRQLRELGITSPWFALPNGFDPVDLATGTAAAHSHAGPARLFYFGRLDAAHKGLDLLLQAVASEPRVHLTLQGPDWGDRASLEALSADLALGDRVRFLDPDYSTPPTRLMADHDLFCLPSRCEGFGLAALEAMLAERPVLLSDVGGLASGVEASGCGVIVEPTVESVLEGLRTLLDRREAWPAMGRAGRAWAAEHLTWERVAADTWTAYQPLVGPARRP